MTVGAAGGLNVALKVLLNPGDEVIVFAPYFGEYRSYTNNFDGVLVEISPNTETFQPKYFGEYRSYTNNFDGVLVEISPNTETFQPKLDEFAEKITERTKAVIVNTPNNPTGVVYSEETIQKLAEIMKEKQEEYGHEIYLVSDEPYRELAYNMDMRSI